MELGCDSCKTCVLRTPVRSSHQSRRKPLAISYLRSASTS